MMVQQMQSAHAYPAKDQVLEELRMALLQVRTLEQKAIAFGAVDDELDAMLDDANCN